MAELLDLQTFHKGLERDVYGHSHWAAYTFIDTAGKPIRFDPEGDVSDTIDMSRHDAGELAVYEGEAIADYGITGASLMYTKSIESRVEPDSALPAATSTDVARLGETVGPEEVVLTQFADDEFRAFAMTIRREGEAVRLIDKEDLTKEQLDTRIRTVLLGAVALDGYAHEEYAAMVTGFLGEVPTEILDAYGESVQDVARLSRGDVASVDKEVAAAYATASAEDKLAVEEAIVAVFDTELLDKMSQPTSTAVVTR